MPLQIQTARVFQPLLKPKRYKAAFGGRASGKSHFFGELAVEESVRHPGTRILCVREVQKTLKESVKLLIEDKIRKFGVEEYFQVQNDKVLSHGGGLILFQGMQDHTADSIKSLEGFNLAYVEEAHTLTARSLELLRPTIRTPKMDGSTSEIWFSWNPRHQSDPVDHFFRGEQGAPDNSIVIKANWRDNPFLPAEMLEEKDLDARMKPDRYDHIWEGAYEPKVVGALWDRFTLHRNRVDQAPEMGRILVSIDPPKKSDEGSNEAGIVVGGLGQDGRGYILRDVSGVMSPEQWARRAIAEYDHHDADAIVVEINNGGEMCKQTIRSIRRNVRVIEVTATRGKHVRAEPISALYATDQVSHVGIFPELESQYCQFTSEGYMGEGSPDRGDAAIWLLTELFPRITRRETNKSHRRPQRANSHYNPHRLRVVRRR